MLMIKVYEKIKNKTKRILKINAIKDFTLYTLSNNNIPNNLLLALTNACNSNCIFCGRQYMKFDKMSMDDDVFFKAVDEFQKIGGKKVVITPVFGEACLYKGILEKIKYLKKLGLEVYLYTNGLNIHKIGIKELLTSGLFFFCISTAPLIKEIYVKMFRNNHYEQLLENIKNTLILFKSTKNITIKRMEIGFRSDRPVELCKKSKDYLNYVKPYLSKRVIVGGFREYSSWNGLFTNEDFLDGMKIRHNKKKWRIPCIRTSDIHITVNGDIRICGCFLNPKTNDYNDLLLGNINHDSIKELYNSKKVWNIKISFLKGTEPPGCKACGEDY